MTKRYLTCPFDCSFVSFVDLLDRDHLDVGNDVVGRAEIEHFLGFCDTADHGAGNTSAPRNQAVGADGNPVQAADRPLSVCRWSSGYRDIFRSRVEAETVSRMKSKYRSYCFEYLRVGRQGESLGAQTFGIRFFGGRSAQHGDFGAEGGSDFYSHMSESAQTENTDFMSFAHVPVAQRRVGGDAGTQKRRDAF